MSEYHLNISGKLKEEDYLIIKKYLDIIEYDDFLMIYPDSEDEIDIDKIIEIVNNSGFHTKLSANKKSGKNYILAAKV